MQTEPLEYVPTLSGGPLGIGISLAKSFGGGRAIFGTPTPEPPAPGNCAALITVSTVLGWSLSRWRMRMPRESICTWSAEQNCTTGLPTGPSFANWVQTGATWGGLNWAWTLHSKNRRLIKRGGRIPEKAASEERKETLQIALGSSSPFLPGCRKSPCVVAFCWTSWGVCRTTRPSRT